MAVTVKPDLISESSLTRDRTGYRIVRVYSVSGLDPAGAYDPKLQAMLASGVPQYGEYHPSLPAARVEEVRAIAQGATVVHVHVQYGTPHGRQPPQVGDAPRLLVSSTVVQRETRYFHGDSGLEEMSVKSPDDTVTQFVTAKVFVPQSIIRYTKRETSSPDAKAKAYVGTVNNADYKDYAAGTLLCTGIRGESDDGEVTFIVTYEFQYSTETDPITSAPLGWKVLAEYVDPRHKAPPATQGSNGRKSFAVQPSADFSALGI
jgi:hypothetical protein